MSMRDKAKSKYNLMLMDGASLIIYLQYTSKEVSNYRDYCGEQAKPWKSPEIPYVKFLISDIRTPWKFPTRVVSM